MSKCLISAQSNERGNNLYTFRRLHFAKDIMNPKDERKYPRTHTHTHINTNKEGKKKET